MEVTMTTSEINPKLLATIRRRIRRFQEDESKPVHRVKKSGKNYSYRVKTGKTLLFTPKKLQLAKGR
jgi:hypothetical protein